MTNTALRAENSNSCTITFKSREHEKFYEEYLKKCRCQDVYHRALVYCLGIDRDTRNNVNKIYNFKTGCVKTECLQEAVLHHEEGMDLIPSNKLLAGMDMSLFTVEDREKVLKEYLELLKDEYDYILIDCMPSLGMLTINALSAADSVLIPVQPQYYAADGLMELLNAHMP